MALSRGRNVRINTGDVNAFLRSQSGPVNKFMQPLAQKVAKRAKQLAPKKTGRLASSIIAKKPLVASTDIAYLVGTPVPYAFWVDQGSDPHIITGKPRLVFRWGRIVGQGYGPGKDVFITKSRRWPKGYVQHPGIVLNSPAPGNRGATPFLAKARDEVVLAALRRAK